MSHFEYLYYLKALQILAIPWAIVIIILNYSGVVVAALAKMERQN